MATTQGMNLPPHQFMMNPATIRTTAMIHGFSETEATNPFTLATGHPEACVNDTWVKHSCELLTVKSVKDGLPVTVESHSISNVI